MKILVALKQVPDTETKIKVAADGRSLDPADVKWITSPYDEYALEEAIRIKEAKGAEVVALSVGGDSTKEVLKNALALGADSAVLLKGDGQGDAYQVAQMIAAYVKDKGFDLILCGNKGLGGDNAAMGPMLAELLNVAQANVIVKLELGEGTFKAEREIEGGSEIVEGALPAVITAQKGLNEPRYASLKGIMAAKKKTIEELDATPATSGAQVSALALPPERPAGRKLEGDAAAQAQALLQALKDEAKVF
ncbi:electron transfer flavoprotein subunit beta [Geothrix limicola]|uniref:Electron transfer flavoprotein subunit beta n=1 Tax=Geothrix limicola TaxID=2927978 RepID=A0ABQ5QIS9_9BACT|nr:electron transfer flavoprotein subunit beta/FixA family protein [Geothrix limicola]GLH74592.1 electron transfer flavoprotein subunit beta [Geothrix limicola]